MERHSDLASAEIGSEMATDFTNRVDDVLADLLCNLLQLLIVEAVQIARPIDRVQKSGSFAHEVLLST